MKTSSLTFWFYRMMQSTRLRFKPSISVKIMLLLITSGKAYAQTFTTRNIGQSNPLAGGSNTITVTITTDNSLAQASVVTVSGLTNAADTPSLALNSVENSGASLFSNGSTQATGALSSGTLTLTVFTGQTVTNSTQYAFSFTIMNPLTAQVPAAASIAASGTKSFAIAAMVAPNEPLLGVVNGANPLLVVLPEFDVRKIGQSNPLAGDRKSTRLNSSHLA